MANEIIPARQFVREMIQTFDGVLAKPEYAHITPLERRAMLMRAALALGGFDMLRMVEEEDK